MKQEVYNSTTLGPIPLSFSGRHLMQALRDEMTDLLHQAYLRGVEGRPKLASGDWDRLSRARGRIAQRMSTLEQKNETFELRDVSTEDLMRELFRRLSVHQEISNEPR